MDFSKPEEWQKWIRRFERFWQASWLSVKSEMNQVNTLVYSMGDEADVILTSLSLNVHVNMFGDLDIDHLVSWPLID